MPPPRPARAAPSPCPPAPPPRPARLCRPLALYPVRLAHAVRSPRSPLHLSRPVRASSCPSCSSPRLVRPHLRTASTGVSSSPSRRGPRHLRPPPPTDHHRRASTRHHTMRSPALMHLHGSFELQTLLFIHLGWTSDSDDNDKFEWDSDGEVEPSLTPTMRNFDAPGPSTLSSKGWINGEAPPTSLIEGFVAMGFPKEMVVRSIKEIGNSDADALLELLLTYKALGDDDAVGNHSTSGCNPPIVEDDNDLDFENWDGDYDAGGRESSSDDSGGEEDFLREMSEKDEKIKSLRGMGFSEDEANMTILICGMDADISVLVDSITASQVEEACHSRNLSDRQVTAGCFDSFGGIKRNRLTEESKKKRKRYGGGAQGNRPSLDGSDEEPMPLPNPMIGFNLPAARKRGYIHNLPTENRSPILPLPPKTIFEAFPHYKKWWPSWDQRTHLNCLQTCMASAKETERIQQALSSSGNPPPQSVQKYVRCQCSKWNLPGTNDKNHKPHGRHPLLHSHPGHITSNAMYLSVWQEYEIKKAKTNITSAWCQLGLDKERFCVDKSARKEEMGQREEKIRGCLEEIESEE
ncbi:DNA (cytosine-5)-methyltransferase DRM2-like [Hordeum vulgare subsp. vulgare]|uniref:DNA (cytosine-5)-methyltransferase DRM2-like n=1 Tax=Hordeum vulgare subsp. vulgare TaxID=112509 RepID=UPI001D1A4527|nr:DNA (cytosine-5)-methyltransferase DRM2-like [Hordeum vulgare subsp. vulgare]